MTRHLLTHFALTLLATAALSTATTIDFEAQGASAPAGFNTTLNSPLTIGIATITGGKLLKNEAGFPAGDSNIDKSAVYATVYGLAGYTDPLVVTFSQPVSNVSLLIANETPDTYSLADNLGNTVSGGNGIVCDASGACPSFVLTLSDNAVTKLTISTLATVGWDFAIDNISFTPSASATPEPAGLWLAGFGLTGLLIYWKRRAIAD